MREETFQSKSFKNIGLLTLVALYFLILVGGIVRSTGSGMGCPDWPKCFGSWVPPTQESQLPADYLDIYRDKRIQKNQKLAGYLQNLGFGQTAQALLANPTAQLETAFNAQKTWIEYVNRLVGVVIGILIFLTLVFSLKYWKTERSIFYLSLLSFLLVGFQGWLGSIVVSTNLLPVMVTIHMALALVIVALLIYAIARSQAPILRERIFGYSGSLAGWLWLILFLSFGQILLGTQVREMIDEIAFNFNYESRDQWIAKLDWSFYIHRSFSSLLLLLNMYVGYRLFKLRDGLLNKLVLALVSFMLAEIVIGVVMVNFAIPAFLQPLHLVIASLIFGVQFYMLTVYFYATRQNGHIRVLA